MEEKLYKRGYYTGAFDLIHNGHIAGIENAAKLCEQLIVGVSTDELIEQYKHKPPVLPLNVRLEIVNKLDEFAYMQEY